MTSVFPAAGCARAANGGPPASVAPSAAAPLSQLRLQTSSPEILMTHSVVRLGCAPGYAVLAFLHHPSRRIASAEGGLALAQSGQLPDAGTSRVLVGADVGVDQERPMGSDRGLDRFAQIGGAIDPHALDAGGTRHGGEIGVVALAGFWIVEISRQVAPAQIATLQSADRSIGIIVPDHPHHRQIVFE